MENTSSTINIWYYPLPPLYLLSCQRLKELLLYCTLYGYSGHTTNYCLPEKPNFCVTPFLKTVTYESKLLDFQKGQALKLNCSIQALGKK